MGTIVTEFADRLFSFIALKYEIVSTREPAEGGPRVEDYDWDSDQFSIDIGRAVMMLSYTYRSAFRKHFISVTQLICSSRETARLYPIIFAKVTYKCHNPLKILVLCSFISEMYLYMYFQTASENASRRYTIPCINCFNNVYKSVLSKIDDPIPKWNDVKHTASLVARGYSIMEPIMNTEHPSQSKLFFNSVQEADLEKRKISQPEDSPELETEYIAAASGAISASGVDERLPSTFSFGTVDQITSNIPGFDEQKADSLEYDHLKEKTDKPSKDSNRETKISSASSSAKAKSKKKKGKKSKK